jgi:hypothetical protein
VNALLNDVFIGGIYLLSLIQVDKHRNYYPDMRVRLLLWEKSDLAPLNIQVRVPGAELVPVEYLACRGLKDGLVVLVSNGVPMRQRCKGNLAAPTQHYQQCIYSHDGSGVN